jgi:hypothetical protein
MRALALRSSGTAPMSDGTNVKYITDRAVRARVPFAHPCNFGFGGNAIVEKLQLIIGLGLTAGLLTAGEPGYTQENGTPVKTIDGTEPGVHADILSLKRTEGGILTLRIAFANETGGEIKNKALPGGGNVENFQLVDFLNKRKYSVMRTSDGACLCTSLNPLTSSEPGKRILWAKFTAPPESVTRISLLLPEAEPLDDIPITK